MTHNAGNWKEELHRTELPIMADLSWEKAIDELFRPYLPPPPAPRPAVNALPAPALPLATPPAFAVVVRSLSSAHAALKVTTQARADRVQTARPTAQPNPAPDHLAEVVVPKVAVPAPAPLPHEVREELLELRTEVMQAVRTQQLQTLMVCGVEPDAGTSFIAGQLTRLLAEFAPLKVAFLTLVPQRENKLQRLVRRPARTPLQFLLRRTELPNLAEIASANGTITMTEMLCHCATEEVLRQMKAAFDLIVIDAPAVAMYSEAAMLAALMDGVILVAQPNVTPLRRMDRAHRRLHKAHAKVLGMVFNQQRRR